jgi:hypothetical protein
LGHNNWKNEGLKGGCERPDTEEKHRCRLEKRIFRPRRRSGITRQMGWADRKAIPRIAGFFYKNLI